MNKNKVFNSLLKRSLAIFVLCLFIVPLTFAAFAENDLAIISDASALEVINKYKPDDDVSFTIEARKTLFGFGGNIYVLYELSPYGYVILLNDTCSLMEASYSETATLPINIDDKDTYYYGGPLVYCKLTENGYINVFDNSLLQNSQISEIATKENQILETKRRVESLNNSSAQTVALNSENQLPSIVYTVEYNYFSSMTKHGVNSVGTCTAVAIQILLGYYDSFVNDDVIATEYEKPSYVEHGSTDAFYELLFDYIYYNHNMQPGGIPLQTAAFRVNDYLTDRFLCMEFAYSTSKTSMITTIGSGDPIIVSMHPDGNDESSHSAVAYRVHFDTVDPAATSIFTLNMGWDPNSQYTFPSNCHLMVDGDWIYRCVYMTNTDHVHNLWTDYSSTSHIKTCRTCSNVFYEDHYKYWNSALGRCTRCRRTDPIIAPVFP